MTNGSLAKALPAIRQKLLLTCSINCANGQVTGASCKEQGLLLHFYHTHSFTSARYFCFYLWVYSRTLERPFTNH